jgi:Holliday junction resolvase RusA-like endonuclease
MIDSFIFHGHPVAAARMTQNTKWSKPAKAYLAYKHALGNAIARAYPHLVLPEPPPASDNKARKKYNAQYSSLRYSITITVWTKKGTPLSDWDNYAKTVCDALALSRVIWNDKLIAYGSCRRFENTPEELIAFTLNLIKD